VTVRAFESNDAVGTPAHRPSQFVDRTVMASAEGDEIRKIGLPSMGPVDHVVNLREVDEPATRKATALVTACDLNPLARRWTSANPFLVKDGTVAVLDREHNLGIAG
jgi:hypothetical protein